MTTTPGPATVPPEGEGGGGDLNDARTVNLSVPATVTPSSSGDLRPGSSASSSPSQPQKKTPQDFIFGKMVGEGSYSSVYLAKDVKTGKEFAIKVCDKQHIIRERKTESIRREKEIMTVLSANRGTNAPFFVHLYATFQDQQRLYFVMTFAYGGELLNQLSKRKCFNKTLSQFYGGEIVQALRHMHKLKICHRDLKPENILLNENGHILITDFGSAKKLTAIPTVASEEAKENPEQPSSGRTRSNSFVGTAQYVSPEVLQGRYGDVGPAADLWALGCILYQFLTGHTPFQAPSEFLIFRKIVKLEYEFPEGFDVDARDIITKLLKVQFTERLGALDSEYYTSIQSHPFFKGVDFDKLHEQEVPSIEDNSVENSSSPLKNKIHAKIPDDYAPGFDPRVIAERFLRSDSDETWEVPVPRQSSEISEDSEESTKSEPVNLPTTTETAQDTSNEVDLDLDLKTTEIMNNMNINIDSSAQPQRCNSDSIGIGIESPMRRYSKGKIHYPEDANERLLFLEEQRKTNPWHKTVKGNLILKQGLVSKKKGLFSRRRMLLLTEGPHLFYCDPNSKVVKGEIPWSQALRPEAKDFKIFYIHTPNRTYYLEDAEGYALTWCDAINTMSQQTYGNNKSIDD